MRLGLGFARRVEASDLGPEAHGGARCRVHWSNPREVVAFDPRSLGCAGGRCRVLTETVKEISFLGGPLECEIRFDPAASGYEGECAVYHVAGSGPRDLVASPSPGPIVLQDTIPAGTGKVYALARAGAPPVPGAIFSGR
ncbi:MAG: hypothetical protein HY812_00635 [Planctomycetes bacterium]|nr:hypothetical protein [Planctomycetota bacterium]